MRLLIIFIFLITSIPITLHANNPNEFKIGVSLALTGPAATFCVPLQKGMILASEENNMASDSKISIVYEDDHCDPKETVSIVQKFLNVDKVDAIITCSSGTSKAVSPIIEKRKLPLIAVATDPEVVKDKKFVVSLWATPESETPVLIDALKERNIKRIARITTQHAAMLVFKEVFDKDNRGNIEIAFDEEVTADVKDFKAVINRMRQDKSLDAIFINLFSGQIGTFAKQAREHGIVAPFFGYELLESEEEVRVSGGALIGSFYVQADEGSSDFLARYKKRFPDSGTFAAANGYDAVSLIASFLKEGKPSSESIAGQLRTLKDFKGALGSYSASGDNRFTLPVTIKEITSDGFKKIAK